jgi:hypothetical protein
MPYHSTLQRPLSLLLLCGYFALTMVLASVSVDPACGVSCGENGSCQPTNVTSACTTTYCRHECVCNHGWIGDDCMLKYEVCEDTISGSPDDARVCYNGGLCESYDLDTPDSDGNTMGIRCNCQTYANDTKAYAGHQCEYAAEEICVRDRFHSSYAFCTNNGTCKGLIDFGGRHPLCDCPKGFAGRHCQFTVDSTSANPLPPEEVELVNTLFNGNGTFYGAHGSNFSNDGDDELSGGMKFFVVFAVVCVIVLACFCFYFCAIKRQRSSKNSESGQEQSKANQSEII